MLPCGRAPASSVGALSAGGCCPVVGLLLRPLGYFLRVGALPWGGSCFIPRPTFCSWPLVCGGGPSSLYSVFGPWPPWWLPAASPPLDRGSAFLPCCSRSSLCLARPRLYVWPAPPAWLAICLWCGIWTGSALRSLSWLVLRVGRSRRWWLLRHLVVVRASRRTSPSCGSSGSAFGSSYSSRTSVLLHRLSGQAAGFRRSFPARPSHSRPQALQAHVVRSFVRLATCAVLLLT